MKEGDLDALDRLELFVYNARKQQKQVQKLTQGLNQMNNKMDSIEEKVDEITSRKVPENYINAARIAAKLDLTSSNDRLHSTLVAKIAKHIGIKAGESAPYEDEYVKVIFGSTNVGELTYYSPKAVNVIENWWRLNQDKLKYTEKYKIDGKYGNKGDIRIAGYKIGKSKFKTYEASKDQKLA
jgi:hypothetical protein